MMFHGLKKCVCRLANQKYIKAGRGSQLSGLARLPGHPALFAQELYQGSASGRGAQPLQRDRRGQRRGRVGARAAGQDHSAGDARRGRARKAAARADRQGPHRLARDEGLVRAHGGTVSRPGQLSSGQVTA